MSSSPWVLHLFEKEKGGVGSTGSLISAAHAVMSRGEPVVFIEASLSQNDILNAYRGHHPTRSVDLTVPDARERILDVVVTSPPGAHVFLNVPSGRAEELDRVHDMIAFIFADEPDFPMDVRLTWTMGLDAASRTTLDLLLDAQPPGRLLLNLPEWHGPMSKYAYVDEVLIQAVEAIGGTIFQMPGLPEHLYDRFRIKEVGLDRIRNSPDMTYGNKVAFSMWEKKVIATLQGIY